MAGSHTCPFFTVQVPRTVPCPAPMEIVLVWMQARNLIGEVSDEKLNLRYKACYARICDSKRKFLEAATHYYELSTYSTIQYAAATFDSAARPTCCNSH